MILSAGPAHGRNLRILHYAFNNCIVYWLAYANCYNFIIPYFSFQGNTPQKRRIGKNCHVFSGCAVMKIRSCALSGTFSRKPGLWLVVRVNKNFLFEKKVGFPESFNMFSPGRRPSFIISCANCRYSISLIALSRTSLS